MVRKRKQYSAQFKAKVALEAIQGVKSVAELASQYEVHPTAINGWKRQVIERAVDLFESAQTGRKQVSSSEAEINELYRQIGQLKVERDFLAERSAKLGFGRERPW